MQPANARYAPAGSVVAAEPLADGGPPLPQPAANRAAAAATRRAGISGGRRVMFGPFGRAREGDGESGQDRSSMRRIALQGGYRVMWLLLALCHGRRCEDRRNDGPA